MTALRIANLAAKADKEGNSKKANIADAVLKKLSTSTDWEYQRGLSEGLRTAIKLFNSAGDDISKINEVRSYVQDTLDEMGDLSSSTFHTSLPESTDELDALLCFDF